MSPHPRYDLEHVHDPSQRPTDADYDRYLWFVKLVKRAACDEATIYRSHPFLVKDVLFSAILVAANDALLEISRLVSASHEERGTHFELDLSRTPRAREPLGSRAPALPRLRPACRQAAEVAHDGRLRPTGGRRPETMAPRDPPGDPQITFVYRLPGVAAASAAEHESEGCQVQPSQLLAGAGLAGD